MMDSMAPRFVAPAATLALLLAAGCSSSADLTFDKPGVSPARFDQDLAQCQREADRPSNFGMSRAQRADQDVLRRCMERKGYQVKRAE